MTIATFRLKNETGELINLNGIYLPQNQPKMFHKYQMTEIKRKSTHKRLKTRSVASAVVPLPAA